MSKVSNETQMLPEYDFSGGVRGKYAARYAEGSNVIVLEPDVAEAFPNSQAVNEALRLLVRLAQQSTSKTAS
jgi:hypothetical protein